MKSLSLSTGKLFELSQVMDSIPVSDLQTTKDVRLASSIVRDLRAACGDYGEKKADFDVKTVALAKPYQERYNTEVTENEKMSEIEKKLLAKKYDEQLMAEIKETYGAEYTALEEQAQTVVTAEISDEKFARLKELFDKYAARFYVVKSVYLEVADALGLE